MTPTLNPATKSGVLRAAMPCQTALCERIKRLAEQGPAAVDERLRELSREWTVGRWVKAVCGVLLLAGIALAAWVDPWWVGAAVVAGSGATLLQYLFFSRGWLGGIVAACGARSGSVIEDERIALRVLRGDFKFLPTLTDIHDKHAVNRMASEGGPAMDNDDIMYDPHEAAQLIAAGSSGVRV